MWAERLNILHNFFTPPQELWCLGCFFLTRCALFMTSSNQVIIKCTNQGPNAPLSNACGNSSQPESSAQAGLNQWTSAGFPASKLLLGLPLYGYVSNSKATSLKAIAIPPPNFPITANKQRSLQCAGAVVEEGEVQGTGEPVPGNHVREKGKKAVAQAGSGDLSSFYGKQIAFSQLISGGALVKQADGTYSAKNGYTYGEYLPVCHQWSIPSAERILAWDDCSSTPVRFTVFARHVDRS
jgi:chitinase